MRAVERAVRADLRAMPEPVRASAIARAAIDLAQRLDAEPADTTAVLLARELRIAMADLREQSKGGGADDVERYLAAVSTKAFDAQH